MNKQIETKENAKKWIEEGKPCAYQYGWGWKGASTKAITQEQARELLPKYRFGIGFYSLSFTTHNNVETLLFNELSENDDKNSPHDFAP